MIRSVPALARFAEVAATAIGDLSQSSRLNLVALTRGEGLASRALMTESRAGASEGSISFLSLDDPALIVSKAAGELRSFGSNLWRAGSLTGDRHPAAGALLDKAHELTKSFGPLDDRVVEFTMKPTASLRVPHGARNFSPLVDKASMLDNLIPAEQVLPQLVGRAGSREAYLAGIQNSWMKYVVKSGIESEGGTARLLGFTENTVGRSRLRVHVPVMSEI